jgi:futalosine hydrolase
MRALGFALGDFEGNRVPVDAALLQGFGHLGARGPIATVATCSGTDAGAQEVARRTGAIAEAMEGAAVAHAARRFGVPALEIRTISNATGNRTMQGWDLPRGLAALKPVGDAIAAFAR